jgi:hypothetical protein
MTKALRAVAGMAFIGAALTMLLAPVEAAQFGDANRWMAKRFERFAVPKVPEVRYADQHRRGNRTKRK